MLTKLKNRIELEISKIGDFKLEEFGIYFSTQPQYFPEGINIIEDGNGSYNIIFTERGRITSEICDLTDDEVGYQISKIIVNVISSQRIDDKSVEKINELIKNNDFDKVSQIVKKEKEEQSQIERKLLKKMNPMYLSWLGSELGSN